MKLLLCSDLHGNVAEAEARAAEAELSEVDVLVCAGDLGNMRADYEKVAAALADFRGDTLLVPGNAESFEELSAACEGLHRTTVLHGSGAELEGIAFWGIGGGVPVTPFGEWSYDFSEEEAEALLANCPAGAVLVSHSPPKGILDTSSAGDSLGSTAVRASMEEKKVPVVVCGHIHACAGQQEEVEGTLVVNAGPKGIFVEL